MTTAKQPARAMRMPRGACDTHVHVFGDARTYRLDERCGYTPPQASLASYRKVMALCGIDRAVLVQPSVYGTDNRMLTDTLRDGGPAFRGVAVPPPRASDSELNHMHESGVRGIRLNLVNRAVLEVDNALDLCRRMASSGWHLQVQLALGGADGRQTLRRLLLASPVPLVIDHMGRSVSSLASRAMTAALASGRTWVKLSAPYRFSADGPPRYADAAEAARRLVGERADRLLWASDWPHTEVEPPLPDAGDFVDLIAQWVPNVDDRHRILVTNPATLYGFDQ